MVRMPGGVGMQSPTLARALPPTVAPPLARGPMANGYGNPQTELIIRQRDPVVARGIPPAVMTGGNIEMIVPVSGGPEAPGVMITIAPTVTGDPGMETSLWRERCHTLEGNHCSL